MRYRGLGLSIFDSSKVVNTSSRCNEHKVCTLYVIKSRLVNRQISRRGGGGCTYVRRYTEKCHIHLDAVLSGSENLCMGFGT